MSYVSSLYQIVLTTYQREKTINPENEKDLYHYIWGIIKQKNCKLIRMNGMEEHIHLLMEIHPSICLSDVVRDIKRCSSIWLRQSPKFPHFSGWGNEYAAFSCSYEAKEIVKSYILNQKHHHAKISFDEEYRSLLDANGLKLYEKE
jgi:REP element-mobilizing transposase RayT